MPLASTDKLKVLWFSNTPCSAVEILGSKGLSGGWLISLEKELAKDPEIELSVAFVWDHPIPCFEHKGVKYIGISSGKKPNKVKRLLDRWTNTRNVLNNVPEYLSVIKEFSPDIIHIHGTESDFGLLQEFTRVPVVVSMQGIMQPVLSKFYSGIPSSIASKYESVLSKILKVTFSELYSSFNYAASREKKIFSLTKSILGRTEWDRVISSLMSPSSHYFTSNEILRDAFYSERHWEKRDFSGSARLVTITSDHIYKGFETLVDTARILKESGFKFSWRVIGVSNTSSTTQIVKKWKDVDLQKLNIVLLGKKDEFEIIEVLEDSDIYCHLSHIENSSNSLCEAMMFGIPAIASFAGGTKSILSDGKEGLLYQDGDAWGLAGLIKDLFANFSLAKNYGFNARNKARERHDKAQIAGNLVKIYTQLASGNNSING